MALVNYYNQSIGMDGNYTYLLCITLKNKYDENKVTHFFYGYDNGNFIMLDYIHSGYDEEQVFQPLNKYHPRFQLAYLFLAYISYSRCDFYQGLRHIVS